MPGDVTDPDAVSRLVDEVLDAWGRIDVLVNNAVRFNTKGVLDMPVDEYRRQVDIILGGAFLMTQAVARSMVERERAGLDHQHPVHRGLAGPGRQHRLLHGEVGDDQLHPLGGHGAGAPTASGSTGSPRPPPCPTTPSWPSASGGATAGAAGAGMDFAGQLPLGRLPTPTDYVPRARLPRLRRVGHDDRHEPHRRRRRAGQVLAAGPRPAEAQGGRR